MKIEKQISETYGVDVHCTNCGHKGETRITKGQHVPVAMTCPICECRTLTAGW
jgi:hypothetical protein